MTNDAPPTITLRIEREGRPAETQTFSAARVLIGRETGDIVLADPESSALHAEIDCSTGAVVVRDLGSSNGTWRDGERLPQFALFVGQSFRCGGTTLTLLASASPLGATPGRTVISKEKHASARPSAPALPPVELDPSAPAQPSSQGTLPGDQRPAPAPVPSTRTVPRIGPPSILPPELGHAAPVLHRDTQTGPPEGPAPVDVTAVAPMSGGTLVAPIASATQPSMPIAHRTEPMGHVVHRTEPVAPAPPLSPFEAPPVATAAPESAPLLRPPVKNALIKPGGASTGKTGPVPVVGPTRKRGLVLAGKIALAAALVAVLGGAIWWAVVAFTHRAPALAATIARELPDSALGFVAMAPPRTQIELFGDEIPSEARDEAKRALG
ncbi:MAG TPA: FHA domain-containing protein, partial [Nannocystaceae bacterium]|nr:FHA domain-containing protein [Nannocystaceae bacterium]